MYSTYLFDERKMLVRLTFQETNRAFDRDPQQFQNFDQTYRLEKFDFISVRRTRLFADACYRDIE